MSRRALPALLLALLLPLAGCISKGDAPEPIPDDDLGNESVAPNAELPDGRGQSAGILETDKTEEGVGGIEHKHDYWGGKEQVLLFDETVFIGCPPCMPDGEGTQAKAVAYVKLGQLPDGGGDALVYEGAERLEILLKAPTSTAFLPAPNPAPPALFLQYRSAADSEFTTPVAIAYDVPLSIDVEPKMTDVPHSLVSLWAFRITTDRPEAGLDVPMQVTVFKGRDVVDWPGHTDFYADTLSRKVMEQHVTTHMSGIESFALYDSGGTWASPERLISWGTTDLLVIINITKTTNAYNAAPTGYFLEAHNATYIGPEIAFGDRYGDKDDENDLATYEFAIELPTREDGRYDPGLDGPYQPASRWGFRAMATFADVAGVVGLCPGCFPYDIEYDIVVFAIQDPAKMAPS